MLIRNTEPNVKHVYGLDRPLLPGVNEVNAEEWTAAKKSAVVVGWIKEGVLEEGDAKVSLTTLEKFSAAQAIELVEETVNGELLLEWQAAEKRGGVLAALQKQLDKLDPTKPNPEE